MPFVSFEIVSVAYLPTYSKPSLRVTLISLLTDSNVPLNEAGDKNPHSTPIFTHLHSSFEIIPLLKKPLPLTLPWDTTSNFSFLWIFPSHLSRPQQVILCSLRPGHTSVTHCYLFFKYPLPTCHRCTQKATVRLIFLECFLHQLARTIVSLASSLPEVIIYNPFPISSLPSFWHQPSGLHTKLFWQAIHQSLISEYRVFSGRTILEKTAHECGGGKALL